MPKPESRKPTPAYQTAKVPADGTPASAFPNLTESKETVRWQHASDPPSSANVGMIFTDAQGRRMVVDPSNWAAYDVNDVEIVNEFNRTVEEQRAFEAAHAAK